MKLWSRRIYADTAASTLPDPKVVSVVSQIMKTNAGNPASLHSSGREAGKILDDSREKIAGLLAVRPEEIIFTSGGSESNNLAIRGVFEAHYKKTGKGGHFVTSAIEHKSVLETVEGCKIFGGKITILPVDSSGQVNLNVLRDSLTEETLLVSVALVNNEIGTVADIKQISKIVSDFRKKQGTAYPYLHTDACQAPRFFSIRPENLGVDLLTFNGSKIYGPKGIGALYIKSDTKISPIIFGGGQEFGLRSGTQNVSVAAGLATALEICEANREKEVKNVAEIRDYLAGEITKRIPEVVFYGPTGMTMRSPNNLNVGFRGVIAEDIVIGLDVLSVEVSTGSACSSRSKPDSHVLKAIGGDTTFSSVRFSLGRDTNKKEANIIVDALAKTVARLSRK